MKKRLAIRAAVKLLSGVLLMGLLLFLPAGTFRFPGAWRMMGILFLPMLLLSAVLFLTKPKLLAKRLKQKETEDAQKAVILISANMFIASFLLCGFDFSRGWSHVPAWLSYVGCAVFLAAYLGFAELLRENEYLSRSVEVQEGQKVVSTGFYGIVRHPMYAIIFWLFLSMPVIVGSFIGLIPMIFLPLTLVGRILNEEEVLRSELEGYEAYMQKVRYRLIPFIW